MTVSPTVAPLIPRNPAACAASCLALGAAVVAGDQPGILAKKAARFILCPMRIMMGKIRKQCIPTDDILFKVA